MKNPRNQATALEVRDCLTRLGGQRISTPAVECWLANGRIIILREYDHGGTDCFRKVSENNSLADLQAALTDYLGGDA